MNISVRVQIIWRQGNIIGLWLNNKKIWEENITDGIIIPNFTTEIIMPFIEAIKFASIIVNGLACNRMEELLAKLFIRMTELKTLQDEEDKNFLDVGEW